MTSIRGKASNTPGEPHAITAGELSRFLEGIPPEAVVVMACDEEGNGYAPLYEAVVTKYSADPKTRERLFQIDLCRHLGEPCMCDAGKPVGATAVMLWPLW